MSSPAPAVLRCERVRRTFWLAEARHRVIALVDINLQIARGSLTAVVGPDGAGKTTLLRLAAGLLQPDAGSIEVLGIDVVREPQSVQDRISYMPQRFGLYEDLSVQENLDLYADLHGIARDVRVPRYARLLEMTDLNKFTTRLAGQLSGGMKQKLGLACTLVRSPELLLLDEPTVGVDPLSRRELWQIIAQLVEEEHLSVIVSTAYLDEAERCAEVVLLRAGRVLANGPPVSLRAQAAGRCYRVTPPPGGPARQLQARLLDAHDLVLDAVPQSGEVWFMTRAEGTVVAAESGREHGESKEVDESNAANATGAANAAGGTSNRLLLDGLTVHERAPRLEDAFMLLIDRDEGVSQGSHLPALSRDRGNPPQAAALHGSREPHSHELTHGPSGDLKASSTDPMNARSEEPPVIEVHDLVRRFGDFVAVANTTFSVRRGEVFGLLGPNGAGKTTTFRMLCGLLPATSGSLRVAGVDLRHARAEARARIGYVAQKFALYGNLSVRENLRFFAGAYGLSGEQSRERIDTVVEQFGLAAVVSGQSGLLAGGYRQRLAMAAALLHEPQILFLDEPTSGADPLARREFWRRITALAQAGTTVVITTHFMEEAEYCDRILIQDAGEVLALGAPQEVRSLGGQGDMEGAFIHIVEQARGGRAS